MTFANGTVISIDPLYKFDICTFLPHKNIGNYQNLTLFNLKDVNIFHIIDQINGFGFPGESLYITLTVPLKPFLF